MKILYISGNIERNPFLFENHNLQSIIFNVRGEHYPRTPYDFNFPDNIFHRAYMDYLETIGVGRSNHSPNITMEMFKKCNAIFALDLQPDQCNSTHIHASKSGPVNVTLNFRIAPLENLTVCFYALHDFCLTFKREPSKPRLIIDNVDANLLLAE